MFLWSRVYKLKNRETSCTFVSLAFELCQPWYFDQSDDLIEEIANQKSQAPVNSLVLSLSVGIVVYSTMAT